MTIIFFLPIRGTLCYTLTQPVMREQQGRKESEVKTMRHIRVYSKTDRLNLPRWEKDQFDFFSMDPVLNRFVWM